MPSARIVPAASRTPALRARPGDEDIVSLGLVAGLARRRWLLMLLSMVISLGLAGGYLALTPPTYESGASLLVDMAHFAGLVAVKK